MLKHLYILFSIAFSITCLSQNDASSSISTNDVLQPVELVNSLELIDAQTEIKTIITKTGIENDKIADLKNLVRDHARQSNIYRKKKTLSQNESFKLKEIDTHYILKLKNLLGDENYGKLLTVVKLN